DFASSLGFPVGESGEDPVDAIATRTGGNGVDFVFDTAAHPSVATAVTRVVRVRGTVVTVGVYKKPVEIDLRTVTFAELTLIDVFPLAETANAFERAMAAGPALKILVASGDAA